MAIRVLLTRSENAFLLLAGLLLSAVAHAEPEPAQKPPPQPIGEDQTVSVTGKVDDDDHDVGDVQNNAIPTSNSSQTVTVTGPKIQPLKPRLSQLLLTIRQPSAPFSIVRLL